MTEQERGPESRGKIRDSLREHQGLIVKTVGVLAVTGLGAAAWINRDAVTELFTDDKGAEVSGYLQAQGMKDFNYRLSKEADSIEIICPETDIYSDSLQLEVIEDSGNIESVTVVIPQNETVSYVGADGSQIKTTTEEVDPLRFALEDYSQQEGLEAFVASTDTCQG